MAAKPKKNLDHPDRKGPRHSQHHLSLLPSGPDEVRDRLLRGDQRDDPGCMLFQPVKTRPGQRHGRPGIAGNPQIFMDPAYANNLLFQEKNMPAPTTGRIRR